MDEEADEDVGEDGDGDGDGDGAGNGNDDDAADVVAAVAPRTLVFRLQFDP